MTPSVQISCRVLGGPHAQVAPQELDGLVAASVAEAGLEGQHVVLVIPDGTRSCPLPLLVGTLHRHLSPVVASLTAVIALGTHSYMEPHEIDRLLGVGGTGQPATLETAYPGLTVVNHEWADPDALVRVGTIPASRISELSGGRLERDAPIVINRHVVESDAAIVVGPVFPHEVVGISGGNKYYI